LPLRRQLRLLGAAMQRHGLRAALVGNAAAALHGAPVRPRDLDFLFVDTRAQRRRLAAIAAELGGALTRPYFHRALRWRLVDAARGLTADFVTGLDGVRDPRAVLARARWLDHDGQPVLVAALVDVLRSKRAADRPRDRATLARLERWLQSTTDRSGPDRR
jgi:hypothetical protein